MDNNEIWQRVIEDADSSYNQDITDWSPIYQWAIPLVGTGVLDVGCGLGHFYGALRGEMVDYQGIDVSEVAVAEATKRFPDGLFRVMMAEDIHQFVDLVDTICFFQVMEHVADDIHVLSLIPKGKRVLISVPMELPHEHEAHIRFFPNLTALVAHYGGEIDIHKAEIVSTCNFLCIFGFKK